MVLDSPKVEALTTELMALNPKALRKRVREFSEEHGVEGHIMRRAMRPKTEDEKEEEADAEEEKREMNERAAGWCS